MHPAISYQLAQARRAGLRHHAQRDTRAPRRLPCRPALPSWPAPCGPHRTGAVPGTAQPLSPPWLAARPLAEPVPPVA